MPTKNVKKVVLYLEDWQKRMIKDVLGLDCNTYTVEISEPLVLRYGIPTNTGLKRMYFTDWQMREMRDMTGISCEFVELDKNIVRSLYAIPSK
jgi:hypothetical protein